MLLSTDQLLIIPFRGRSLYYDRNVNHEEVRFVVYFEICVEMDKRICNNVVNYRNCIYFDKHSCR